MSNRERRVTLALKWHHLDNLSPQEVRDRFEEEGVGDYTLSTIRNYLNEAPADEVLEQIEQEHANVRLQIAEREERMFQRAREAEAESVEDEPIKRVVPQTTQVPPDVDGPIRATEWEEVTPEDDDYPEWATERDVIIRFTDGRHEVYPGERRPIQGIDGSPKYTTEFVGLRRDQPDLQAQAMARQEQSSHLQAKGEALGIYKTEIDMHVDGDVEHSVEFDAETAAAIREATLDDE